MSCLNLFTNDAKSSPSLVLVALDGEMEKLIAQREYKTAFQTIIKELEEDPENKEELKELFSFVLETYW